MLYFIHVMAIRASDAKINVERYWGDSFDKLLELIMSFLVLGQ